mmetsp:Transcript_36988/g.57867  ORF Transcript_36988/g.57867 Transcript_36988/m.57867 type:complete len:169 (-) Transcript_36988:189-695(-)
MLCIGVGIRCSSSSFFSLVVRFRICSDRAGITALEAQDRIQRAVFDPGHQGFDGRFRFDTMEPKQAGVLGTCRSEAINGPLAPGSIPCIMFKGLHRPEGIRKEKFTDEVALTIFEMGTSLSRIKAFSRSKFITDNCDEGRNYQTLEQIVLQMNLTRYVQTTLHGCPQK